MELSKLILHRGSDAVIGKNLRRFETSVTWAESRLGILGLGVGYIFKENEFDINEALQHLQNGIGGIEFDVQELRGVPVVSHPRVLQAIIGRGYKGTDSAVELSEVAERIRPEIGSAEVFVHLKVHKKDIIEQTVQILNDAGLMPNVLFQTYYPSHLRLIEGRFAYMGLLTRKTMEILQRPENRRSKFGIPAMLARSTSVLNYLKQRYPEMGLHINLTHDKKLIQAVASGTLAVDSIMVANYN